MRKILQAMKDRDMAFIQQFCQEGTYIGEKGEPVNGVCRTLTAEEVLNFMHIHDAHLVEVLNEKECDYCQGMGTVRESVEGDSGVGEIQTFDCGKCGGSGIAK